MTVNRPVKQAVRDLGLRAGSVEPFRILSGAADEVLRRDFVVDQLLERDNIALAVGYPETAKSTFAVALAGAIASGIPFCGHQVNDQPHSVLIFAPERPAEMRRRVRAFESYSAVDLTSVGIVGEDLDFTRGEEHARRAIATARDQEQRTGKKLGLIVFDTVFDLLGGGDENHPRDMGSVSRALQLIRNEAGAPILAICHPSMDRPHEPRGHKSLLAKADVTLVLSYEQKTGTRRWRVQKANSLEVKPKGLFVCKSVRIGADTAPVLEAGGVIAPAGSREDIVRKLIESSTGHLVVSDLAKSAHSTTAFKELENDACRVAVDRILKTLSTAGIVELSGTGKGRQVRMIAS